MQVHFKLFILLGALIFYEQCDTSENITISVVTMLETPYIFLRDSFVPLTGKKRYEGFMVDLIDLIAKKLGKRNCFHMAGGEWDGLIGEVHKDRATIGAAPITITSAREAAVDFTVSFMNLGISILYKRPSAGKTLPFNNVEELAELKTTNFGCVRGGSTCEFLAESDNPTYKRIFERMKSSNPPTFVSTVNEGIERVKNEDFAFFMESATLEYVVRHECELRQVGGLLNSKIPKGSPMRAKLSQAILELQEAGDIAALKNKWWKKRNGEQCGY